MRKRQFKKVLSLVLALAMVFSMNTSVFATADVTVPAAETQTEAQPETPVTNETEAPAPAETPAAEETAPVEAPAAETPAVEAPAAEAPAAEAPAADEPAKEEAAEAAPAEEAPKAEEAAKAEAEVKEEAAEAVPAVEAEEAAGENIEWKDDIDGIKVGFLKADGTPSANHAQIAKKPESTSADYVISVNGTIVGDELIVVEGKDGATPSINKIYVSADSAASMNLLNKLVLSGNAIAYNGGKIYRNDTGEIVTGWGITLHKGYVYSQTSGNIVKLDKERTIQDNFDAQWIYKDSPVSMTVSCDKWSASFNEAVTEVYNDSLSNASLYKGDARKDDVKLENIGETHIDDTDVFVRRANGYLASVDIVRFGFIPLKGDEVSAAVASATSKVVSVNVTQGTHYIVYDKAEWGENEKDLIDFAPETGWKEIKDNEISVNFAGPNQTKYVLIRNKAKDNRLTRYGYLELISRAEVNKDWVSQNGIWSATDGFEVWVDDATTPKKLLVSGNVTGGDNITLTAGSEKATGVEQIVVSGDDVKSITIVPSANKVGTSIKDAVVYSLSGDQIGKKIKTAANSVIEWTFDKVNYVSFNETSISVEGGDTIFATTVLDPAKHYSLSMDDITMALSGDNAGQIVYAGDKAVDPAVPVSKDKTKGTDVYPYIGKDVVIELTAGPEKTKYGLVKIPSGTESVASASIGTITPDTFTMTAEDGVNYAVTSQSANTGDELRALKYTEKGIGSITVSKDQAGKPLNRGMLYYVYGQKKSTNSSHFTGYSDAATVRMGVSFNVVLTLTTSANFYKGAMINGNDLSFTVVPGTKFLSANEANVPVELEVTNDILNDVADVAYEYYSISTDEAFKKGKIDFSASGNSVALPFSGWSYVSINDASIHPRDTKNTVKLDKIQNLKKYVLEGNETLTVEPAKYYYGLTAEEFVSKSKFKASGNEIESSTIVATIGTVSDGKITPKDPEKFNAGETFGALFRDKTKTSISTDKIITVSVNKRPVDLSAKLNFFSKQGEILSADKVDKKDLVVQDLYGTEYDVPEEAFDGNKYFDTTKDVKTDFSKVEYKKDGDLAIIKSSQNYGLTYTRKSGVSDNNYAITAGNYAGFGYYVAPVYDVTFNGKFTKATAKLADKDGKTLGDIDIKSPGAVAISSAAAVKLAAGGYKDAAEKPVTDFDPYAYFNVPAKKDVNAKGIFIKWKDAEKAELADGVFQKISDNKAVYYADVREMTPGYTNPENALLISMDDEFTFTGNKLVTDYREQANDTECAARPGVGAAIEKTRQNSLKNSGVINLGVFVGNTRLVENYDYTVAYKNNINRYDLPDDFASIDAKKAPQLTITFKNGYKQYPAVTKYFSIRPADLSEITEGTGVDSRIIKVNKRVTEKDKIFKKTDLININTGKALKWNKDPQKSDIYFEVAAEDINKTDGAVTVKILGTSEENKNTKSNYKGELETTVYFIDGKITTNTINIKAGKVDGEKSEIDYTNQDFVKEGYVDKIGEAIEEAIKTDSKKKSPEGATFDGMSLLRVKANYRVPGKKKLNYKVLVIPESGAPIAYKGAFNYTIKPINTTQLEEIKSSVEWDGGKVSNENEIHVPYVKAGATIAPSATYNGKDNDCLDLFKVSFKNNKKAGATATAVLAPIASYFDKDAKKAVKEDKTKFNVSFIVDKADLADANVRTAYYLKGKTSEKDLKSLGGIVLTDDMGDVIAYPKDYTVDIPNDKAVASSKTKIFKENSERALSANELETYYLGAATIKINKKASGWSNRGGIDPADIENLTSGQTASENAVLNAKFAAKYGLELYVKGNRKALTQVNNSISGNNFNFIVTQNAKGTQCTIQAVGCGTAGAKDCGAFGGDNVLASKAVKAAVKK